MSEPVPYGLKDDKGQGRVIVETTMKKRTFEDIEPKSLKKVRSRMPCCRRCGEIFRATGKFAKICPKCRLPAGNKSMPKKGINDDSQ
jgi:tRNA(Ile2) C34 agmatinyltransferase TiaS